MTSDPELPKLEAGVYLHNKTQHKYEVLGVALQTETSEPLVIYRALWDSTIELFARPYAMFVETVEIDSKHVPRFEKVHS